MKQIEIIIFVVTIIITGSPLCSALPPELCSAPSQTVDSTKFPGILYTIVLSKPINNTKDQVCSYFAITSDGKVVIYSKNSSVVIILKDIITGNNFVDTMPKEPNKILKILTTDNSTYVVFVQCENGTGNILLFKKKY